MKAVRLRYHVLPFLLLLKIGMEDLWITITAWKILIYNAEGSVIGKAYKRDYSWDPSMQLFCKFLKENVGEAQVFGLHISRKAD